MPWTRKETRITSGTTAVSYAMPQPTPTPDAELPSPIERDNTFETVVENGGRAVVPLRAGVDFQLTPRMHASVAMTAIPGMPEG